MEIKSKIKSALKNSKIFAVGKKSLSKRMTYTALSAVISLGAQVVNAKDLNSDSVNLKGPDLSKISTDHSERSNILQGIMKSNLEDLAEYNLRVNKNGIKVHTYKKEGSDISTFQGEILINGSIDSIVAVMLDNKSCGEWVYQCKESILLKNMGIKERIHYQVADLPFPVSDREFIFHSKLERDPKTKEILIVMKSAHDYCDDKVDEQCDRINESDLVRVTESVGAYRLIPKDNGVLVKWEQHTDPSGDLPSVLVNQLLEDIPYETLKNLSEMVHKKEYKKAKLIYSNDGAPIDLVGTSIHGFNGQRNSEGSVADTGVTRRIEEKSTVSTQQSDLGFDLN